MVIAHIWVILDQDPSTVAMEIFLPSCPTTPTKQAPKKILGFTHRVSALVTTRILLFFRCRKSQPPQAQSLDFWSMAGSTYPTPPGPRLTPPEIAGPMNHWFPFIRPVIKQLAISWRRGYVALGESQLASFVSRSVCV